MQRCPTRTLCAVSAENLSRTLALLAFIELNLDDCTAYGLQRQVGVPVCAAGACKVLLKRGSCILIYALVTIDPSRTGKLRAVFGNPSCSVLTRGKAARSATSDDSRSRNVVKRYSLPLTIIPPIHRCQGKRRSMQSVACNLLREFVLNPPPVPYLNTMGMDSPQKDRD